MGHFPCGCTKGESGDSVLNRFDHMLLSGWSKKLKEFLHNGLFFFFFLLELRTSSKTRTVVSKQMSEIAGVCE